jgi:hypothetical protein
LQKKRATTRILKGTLRKTGKMFSKCRISSGVQ